MRQSMLCCKVLAEVVIIRCLCQFHSLRSMWEDKCLLNYSRDTKSQKQVNNVKNIVYEALSILDLSFRKESIRINLCGTRDFLS